MKKILVDATIYYDGGPSDRGADAGSYWIPASLRPIHWTFEETEQDRHLRIERHKEIARYVKEVYGVRDAIDLSYREVKDVRARVAEWRAELNRLSRLLNH